ncbi:tRNA pseudouridine(13) synthase TruD [Halomonas sp. PR-M31]|uniref:tRNA pseudouridine(13) synthase TruD n=1 Tax=Halomonas sp. PR-M31 TaxID=1471202 RepID=UPI0006510590|nr:tRNA pseudouridine(13) synthase TruD [Halomonas sp. PR-M31]
MTETSDAIWPPVWPCAHGGPLTDGDYRRAPEDFFVEECLGFQPEGHGEHLWLWVEKRELTTLELARRLARACDVTPRQMGFSGMKDRVAVTRQWLSVHLPGREAPADLIGRLGDTPVRILEQHRHPRKLKRGVHRANRFTLRLSGAIVDHPALEPHWQTLCERGVPNYFGPQRFGPDGRNLFRARDVLRRGWRKRDDREGMMLSSARSYLFNELLARRVAENNWATPLAGDVLMLDGSASQFVTQQHDETLVERALRLDLHPTGVLWGTGGSLAQHQAVRYEQQLGDKHADLCKGLEGAGVRLARRALRVVLGAPTVSHDEDNLVLGFELPRGAFATAVLRELIRHPTLI